MAAEIPTRWEAWVERMLPPGLPTEARSRSRFFVRGWTVASTFAAISQTLYLSTAMWSQVATTALLVCSGPVVLWLHRRGVNFTGLAHASLAIAALVFGLSALAQRPADYTSLSLMLIVPSLAGFLLGSRRAVPWLFITAAWAALVIYAMDHGWLADFVDPVPTLSHAINFSVGLVVAWLFASTFDDVSEQALAELRRLDRSRSAFLANISHEIRTPMNGVLGMTEVLLQDQLSPLHREQLSIIQRSGRTLVSLINDLLDVSKMEAGKLVLETADFNLSTVLADVQALSAANATSKGLTLKVRKADDVPARLRGDGRRLSQVLTNLVSNAVKFTATGTVTLEVTRRPGDDAVHCDFAITDTGVGIAPAVLPLLFNAFQQGDSSTTRRFGGTGLGLALSQQLVTLMGGKILVTSRPGAGSRFSFGVSFDEAEEPSAVHILPPRSVEGPRRTVLVVDDNAINLKVAVSLVEKAGFQADGAVNGKAALEAVRNGHYALVLMDCHMPEMDGFEATEHIRALEGELRHTPIVALTASAMPDELAACRRVGMNSVLAKPLTFAALRETLREQLG
ncbi:MAG: ATP-binding protein [Archangium sp.]|nr:ATP-binding protein [Archangium sp.]